MVLVVPADLAASLALGAAASVDAASAFVLACPVGIRTRQNGRLLMPGRDIATGPRSTDAKYIPEVQQRAKSLDTTSILNLVRGKAAV